MKIRFLLIALVGIICLGFARQGDKAKQQAQQTNVPAQQKSSERGRSYEEVNGPISWQYDENTDQKGILHADKAGKLFREEGRSKGHRIELDSLLTEGTAALPYSIQATDLDQADEQRRKLERRGGDKDWAVTNIQRSRIEMSWTRTSKPRQYMYVARLDISKRFHTFIMSASDEFGLWGPVAYYITNVDTNGYFLSSLCIAGHDSPLKLKTAAISADGVISCSTFKQIWEKDPLEYGYEKNRVKESKPTGEKTYKITADGDIVLR